MREVLLDAYEALNEKYNKLIEFVKENPFVNDSDEKIIQQLNNPCLDDIDFFHLLIAKKTRKILQEIGEL